MSGRRPSKKVLSRPFVVTVALGIPTVTAIVFGCGTDKPPGDGGSSGVNPIPPVAGDGSCTQEGAIQSCHADLGAHGGLQTCFFGTQSCLGGRWSACGGSGTVVNATADNLKTAMDRAGLTSQLQGLANATGTTVLDGSADAGICKKACVGGANNGQNCAVDSDCPDIQCANVKRCVGGADDGTPCSKNSDCSKNSCKNSKVCLGGPNSGNTCAVDTDCPGSGVTPKCLKGDVCNPDCQGWDLPPSAVTANGDAGIGVSGYGQIPSGQLNKLLDDGCHPGGLGSCNTGQTTLYNCQLDTYCDMTAGCCQQFPVLSNMATVPNSPGSYGALENDITIGPGCCDTCRSYRDYPICNRGLGTIAPGTAIKTSIVTPNSTQNPCPTYASPECSTTVDVAHGADPLGLLPGTCMLMNMATDCVGGEPSGEKWLYVNANQAVPEGTLTNNPATVPPTTPACANNWGDHTNANNPPACRTSSTNAQFTQDFYASCPVGYQVQWDTLTWLTSQASSGGDDTEIIFEAATAPAYPDGGPSGALSNFYEIGEASNGSNNKDTASCTFAGPTTSTQCTNATAAGALAPGPTPPCCPKSFFDQFSRPTTVTTALFAGAGPGPGKALARQPFLEMRVILRGTADGKKSPTLDAWSISYSCVPNE